MELAGCVGRAIERSRDSDFSAWGPSKLMSRNKHNYTVSTQAQERNRVHTSFSSSQSCRQEWAEKYMEVEMYAHLPRARAPDRLRKPKHAAHASLSKFRNTSVHSDRGPRAWGSGAIARCVEQHQKTTIVTSIVIVALVLGGPERVRVVLSSS